MHAADGVLVEHLGDAAFCGGSANPRITALDFVGVPRGFGGGIVRGQFGYGGNFQAASVRQKDGAAFIGIQQQVRGIGADGGGTVFQAARHAPVGQNFKLNLGAQHKHPQPFGNGFGKVGGECHQKAVACVVHNHVGDDAAFGGVVGGIAGLVGRQVFDVVGKLSVQEGAAVVAGGTDDAEEGQEGVHGISFLCVYSRLK